MSSWGRQGASCSRDQPYSRACVGTCWPHLRYRRALHDRRGSRRHSRRPGTGSRPMTKRLNRVVPPAASAFTDMTPGRGGSPGPDPRGPGAWSRTRLSYVSGDFDRPRCHHTTLAGLPRHVRGRCNRCGSDGGSGGPFAGHFRGAGPVGPALAPAPKPAASPVAPNPGRRRIVDMIPSPQRSTARAVTHTHSSSTRRQSLRSRSS